MSDFDPASFYEQVGGRPTFERLVSAFYRGVATDEAMVSGEAPGSLAVTEMVGKSTFGNSETGRAR